MSFGSLRAASEILAGLDDQTLIGELDAGVLWFKKRAHEAAAEVASDWGSSAAMIQFGLERAADAHRGPNLHLWLTEARREAASSEPGNPGVVIQVLAGNIAGLCLPAVLEVLLARCSVVLKPSHKETVTARVLADCISEAAPRLSGAVRVLGPERPHKQVLDDADMVIASGGNAAVAALRGTVSVPFFGYGSMYSMGLMGSQTRPEDWRDAAREIALWETRGCLSPVVLLVSGSLERAGESLAEALAQRQEDWPAPRVLAEASGVQEFRAHQQMLSGGGVLSSKAVEWTVGWDTELSVRPGPGARAVRLAPLPTPEDLASLIKHAPIQCVGMSGFNKADREEYCKVAEASEVPRVCALNTIQDPPAGWNPNGRSVMVELLRRSP